MSMQAVYFPTPAEFRAWLSRNAERMEFLWVGYYKVGSGKASITWPQSVDEALCFGWIDGIRKSIDAQRYMIRFTRRKRSSVWSAVNVARARELHKRKLMQPSGLEAFKARRENRTGIYSFEQRTVELPEPYATRFKRQAGAARYFASQPPSYRKAAVWWVVSAKQEITRERRLARLMEDCASERRLAQFVSAAPRRR
jgi:uncharacterized protein YdeI (YjbR/CyaY-like superfamily)